MLWKGLTVPALANANLHGHLDNTAAAPTQTIKEGTNDAAVGRPQPRVLLLVGHGLEGPPLPPWLHGASHRLPAHWMHVGHGCLGLHAPGV
jgi:hypothetical protein